MLKKYSLRLLSVVVVLGTAVSPSLAQSQSQKGAVMGGVAGAIIGGIAGHQNDETPEGIAIGGVAGAIAGGLLGKAQDNQMHRQYQYQQAEYAQAQYQMSRAVSINDAITMSRSGLSPNLIVSQIRQSGVQQEIGVQEVIFLHENGVTEAVIQEMQRAQIGATAPAAVVVKQRPVYVQPQPTVIVEQYPVYRPAHYHYVPHNAHRYHGGYHR